MSANVTAFHRPARKPFNPLLGETFEWIREDKGFRFVAEQVREPITDTVSKRQRLYSVSVEDTLKTYCVCRGIEVSIEEESTLRAHTVSKRQCVYKGKGHTEDILCI